MEFYLNQANTSYQALKNATVFPADNHGFSNWVFKTPLTIYSTNMNEKHVFIDGRARVEAINNANLEHKWKYFVITKNSGNRLYCSSQIFYEKQIIKVEEPSLFGFASTSVSHLEFLLPKCIIFTSDKPYFKLMTNLIKIYREIRKNNPSICCENANLRQSAQNKSWVSKDDHYQHESTIKEKRSLASSSVIISNPKAKETRPKTNELCKDVLMSYYVNLIDGAQWGEKIYRCNETKIEILHTYFLSDSLYRITYFFHVPLSTPNILTLISAILQEKQIIFMSNNQNLNIMVMETILEMIRPLRWEFMYAPNLPISMFEVAELSFMPYLVGIHRKNIGKINQKDRVIINIDNDEILCEGGIVEMPESLKKRFQGDMGPKRSYVEWEKEMRSMALGLVSELLTECLCLESKVYSQQDYEFYSSFCQNSSMFCLFKEELYKQQNIEMNELVQNHPEARSFIIDNRFKQAIINSTYPTLIDNQEEWNKFFSHYQDQEQTKKSLKNYKKSVNSRSNESLERVSIGKFDGFDGIKEFKDKGAIRRRNTLTKKGINFVHSAVKV